MTAQPTTMEGLRKGHKLKTFHDDIERIYWAIGDVAKMLNVEPSTIRFWEMAFNIQVKKNRQGDRRFTKEDLDKFVEIHRLLKVEMHTLEGAKRKLSV